MIVLLNDYELLGRLLVEEAKTRRKQTLQNEALNVRNTKTKMAKIQCMPCKILNTSVVKRKKDVPTIR